MPTVGWDGFAWNLAEIIASGAIGIGTSPGSVPDDWNNMIENAKQACQDFFGFVGDTMKIYRFFDGSCYKYYAKADFVEWLREWMWVDCIVSYSAPNDAEMTDFMRTIYNSVSSHKYAVCWVWEDNMHFAYSDHGKLRIYNGNTSGAAQYYLDRPDGGTFTCFYVTPAGSQSVSQTLSSTRVFADSWMWIGTDNEKEIVSSFDLGYVAPLEVPISEGYPEWVQNSVYIPAEVAGTEEEVLALPLGLGQTLDETQGLNQEQIWAGESTLEVEIEEALEGTVSGTTWADFTTWFGQKLEWIPKQILEGITSIFVPKEDFLTAKWEAIRAEFAFADSIMTSGDMILGVLNGIDPEPPVIYIDLGASEGSYDIGGEVPFLDLRWYERYKPTGDAIISAFLWLVFVWRMFIKLPGIIGGLPGDFVMQGVVNLGLSEHLPARKKEYEYERQQNRRSMKK